MTEIHPPAEGGHGDAPAYLLGALDAAARERFERHAAACEDCRHELHHLEPVAGSLGLHVAQVDPPAHLRAKLLARAVMTARQAGEGLSTDPMSRLAAGMPPFETRPTRRRWSLGERLSAFTAVAALAVALLSGGLAFAERQQTERTTQQAARLAETLSVMYQPGMVWRLLQGTEEAPQSKGRVFFAPDTAHAVLMTYDLPKLPQHESYQFWLNNPEESRRVSGGTFTVDERGRGHLVVKSPDAIERFKACGVTREPVKGSASPTGPRMMAGQL